MAQPHHGRRRARGVRGWLIAGQTGITFHYRTLVPNTLEDQRMNKVLERAIEKVRTLSKERQDYAAELLEVIAAD